MTMPDFMISLFAQSGWLAWLVFVLAVSGAAFWCCFAWVMAGRVTDRVLARLPADDLPEYEPDEEPADDWPEAEPEWFQSLAWGPRGPHAPVTPEEDMAGLARVLERAVELGLLEPGEAKDQLVGERCTDRDCDLHGFIHPPPCVLMPTMPAACYTDPAGPAGPPVPWSGLHASLETLARSEDVPPALHPVVAAELGHDTTEGAVDSMFTRAMAKEVNRRTETGNG
jgi:hypothetical protein